MIENVRIMQINLDHRTDRWEECLRNHQEMGFKGLVERLPGCWVKDLGSLGCAYSQIKSLSTFFVDNSEEYLMVLEDDFDFKITSADLDARLEAIHADGIDWDVLVLAASDARILGGPLPWLARAFETLAPSAYIVARRYVPKLMEYAVDAAVNLNAHRQFSPQPFFVSRFAIDVTWQQLQHIDKWYIFNPVLGTQRPSFSDIEGIFVDYSHMPGNQR